MPFTWKWMTVLKWLRWAGLPLLPNTLNFPMWHPCSKEKVHARYKPRSDVSSSVLTSYNSKNIEHQTCVRDKHPSFSGTFATSISIHFMLFQFSFVSCWQACDCSVGAHHGGNQPCDWECSIKAWHQNGGSKRNEEKYSLNSHVNSRKTSWLHDAPLFANSQFQATASFPP